MQSQKAHSPIQTNTREKFISIWFVNLDADDSDTDSEPIAMENGISEQHQTVYAEVLYTFKAVGAEELSLERGALVEVLRMETGPWWWGQIKHDAILSPQNEQRQGWFPRDFVKVSESKHTHTH